MKSAVFLTFLVSASNAFQSQHAFSKLSLLARSSSSLNALSTAPAAKESLMNVAERIKADEGVFVYDAAAKSELTEAVAELEAVASAPTQADFEQLYKGDWTLVCTTVATEKKGIDLSKIPFLNEGPLKQVRQALNRRVKVLQRIRSTSDSSTVDRVDHVIEFMPAASLEDIFDVPDALKGLNVNPLELTKSIVTLVHKAEVESVVPKLTTKLSLESVILNVAGQSQFLDPVGADVLSLNVPLGEFLSGGSFDTTYMDETIRISRGKLGMVDQLRVFVRADLMAEGLSSEASVTEEVTIGNGDDYPSDVELADVEWVGDDETADGADEVADSTPEPETNDGDSSNDDDSSNDSDSSMDDYPSDVEA